MNQSQPIQPNSHESSHGENGRNHNGIFIAVFVMLCVLTGLSFWIANSHLMENKYVGWGSMMAVSAAKAMLVILFFMHLWWEKRWKYVLTVPALIMGVLLVMLLVPDVGFRTQTYSNERRANAPAAIVDSVEANASGTTTSGTTTSGSPAESTPLAPAKH